MRTSTAATSLLLLLFLQLLALPVSALGSDQDSAQGASKVALEYTTASLLSEYEQIDGEQNIWLLFQLDIRPGWHTYWKNPGDSGLAPRLDWTLPQGVSASSIHWQPPHRYSIPPLMNYGYGGTSYHLVELSMPEAGLPTSNLPVQLNAYWLVCDEECVPEETQLSLTLPVAEQAKPSAHRATIQQLRSSTQHPSLPIKTQAIGDTTFEISFPLAADSNVEEAYFFAEQPGVVETAAPQTFRIEDNHLHLVLTRGFAEVPSQLSGLIELTRQGGTQYLTAVQTSVPVAEAGSSIPGLMLALVMAFLGGIILNAMPCVFPVLSFKALALVKKSEQNPAQLRLQGIAYSAGVVLSFVAIGGILLALKASGTALGWGFQMQSPLFVAILAYLMFLIGLNLSGLFEISLAFGGGQQLAGRQSWVGSFATGALATLVATPCTAPFMASALGAALVLPAYQGLLIFLCLGLGLALPFLLLCWLPQLIYRLPKPGPWMERFRQLLAFPMYLTALWLLWVLGLQTGINAMAIALAGMLGLVFAIWLWQSQSSRKYGQGLSLILLLLLGLSPLLYIATQGDESIAQADSSSKAQASATGLATEPYTPAKLNRYLQAGTPVFVYGTASWCITCKVNERVALNTDAVKTHFQDRGMAVLKADWTNADPKITEFLQRFGRSGVPIYIYYPPGAEPIILPQILTPTIIRNSTSATST